MDTSTVSVVSVEIKGWVDVSSVIVDVSGSWGNRCFFASCESSLECCWSSCFRLSVWSYLGYFYFLFVVDSR